MPSTSGSWLNVTAYRPGGSAVSHVGRTIAYGRPLDRTSSSAATRSFSRSGVLSAWADPWPTENPLTSTTGEAVGAESSQACSTTCTCPATDSTRRAGTSTTPPTRTIADRSEAVCSGVSTTLTSRP